MAGQVLRTSAACQKQQTHSSLLKAQMDYLLVDAGAFVPAGAVLEPLSHPTSAKQATSANNESIFIVMCILILFMFAYSCLGRLALGVESTKCRGVGKHYFWAFFEVARSARKWRASPHFVARLVCSTLSSRPQISGQLCGKVLVAGARCAASIRQFQNQHAWFHAQTFNAL